MRQRWCTLLVLVPLLAGCAEAGWSGIKTPFVKPVTVASFPAGEFALVYADIKAAYVLLAANVVAACRAKAMAEETCVAAREAQIRIESFDQQVRNTIRDPGVTVDWRAVGEAVRTVTSLAIAVGIPGGGALVKIPQALGAAGQMLGK